MYFCNLSKLASKIILMYLLKLRRSKGAIKSLASEKAAGPDSVTSEY
jgi:hypothetical protein